MKKFKTIIWEEEKVWTEHEIIFEAKDIDEANNILKERLSEVPYEYVQTLGSSYSGIIERYDTDNSEIEEL